MEIESYQIPRSFQSYLEQFETDPENALKRLEAHVVKRNTGAAGYFFLAWMHYQNGTKKKAIQAAWKAKVHAPGSLLMDRLHYFLVHPNAFDAWQPDHAKKNTGTFKGDDTAYPIDDLDLLISKLSSIETRRVKPDFSKTSDTDLSEKSSRVDDIVTETLAVIHEKQENYSEAINTYKKLRLGDSSKKEYYDEQIFRLQQKKAEEK